MARLFYHTMQDNAGNLLFDVSGTMRLAGTGTAATIYGDEALTVILPNPMTNHPSFGSFKCFLPVGDFDFYMAKAGYTFETLTGVQGHGTMAQQDASAVAITGGTATGLAGFSNPSGDAYVYGLRVGAGGTLTAQGQLLVASNMAVNAPIDSFYQIMLAWDKTARRGLGFKPLNNDTGFEVVFFLNVAGGTVGSISTTASATAYNTSSDVRLKESIATLVGALDVVRALRPVSFRWQADGSQGKGFLAHELMQTIPEAVSGLPDEVNDDGSIKPQQVDHSRLVPWLTAALQDTLAQVQALQARVAVLEDALGV